MTRRRLRPDELALWRKVAGSIHRLHPDRPDPPALRKSAGPPPAPAPAPPAAPKPAPGTAVPRDFDIAGGAGRAGPPPVSAPAAGRSKPALHMDRKSFGRMTRGKLEPEARIDLHGMTLEQAHPALIGFILQSQAMQRRLVLVITGKGRTGAGDGAFPRQKGVLKRQVPLWLRMAPCAPAVLQIAEAHLRHGGSGAYYVYLRRPR